MDRAIKQLLLIATASDFDLRNLAIRMRKNGLVAGSNTDGLAEAMREMSIKALRMEGIIE